MFINLDCQQQVPESRQVNLKCEWSQKKKNLQQCNEECWMINSPCTQAVSRGQWQGFGKWKGKPLLRLRQTVVFPKYQSPHIPLKDSDINGKLPIFSLSVMRNTFFLLLFITVKNTMTFSEQRTDDLPDPFSCQSVSPMVGTSKGIKYTGNGEGRLSSWHREI